MENDDLKNSSKELADKIPDLAFDWYARLIPGFISLCLVYYVYRIEITVILQNFWFVALIAYIVGHITQPFSSGILQRRFRNLRGKKSPLLSKAYSELIGFFSCLLLSLFFLTYKIIEDLLNDSSPTFHKYYIVLFSSILLFSMAVHSRKKAYDRKYLDQQQETQRPISQRRRS